MTFPGVNGRGFAAPQLPRTTWANSGERLAYLATEAPRLPWDRFVSNVFTPRPGEHVAIIGPTGQGKTVLQNNILPRYPFVVAFATKPADISMERLIEQGDYLRMQSWRSLSALDHPRRVLWPDAKDITAIERQKKVFGDAFHKIFREGGRPAESPVGWAVAIDELWYIVNVLGLDMEVRMFLLQGRSLGHSLIVATQRPSMVPLEVYDQSTHLFFFRDNDRRNLDRLSQINARDSAVIRDVVSNLDSHQVLYINTRTGQMARTRAPVPKETRK
jgi:hypothetical protein